MKRVSSPGNQRGVTERVQQSAATRKTVVESHAHNDGVVEVIFHTEM